MRIDKPTTINVAGYPLSINADKSSVTASVVYPDGGSSMSTIPAEHLTHCRC